MRQLQKDLVKTQRKAFAIGTVKNIKSQWNKFIEFVSHLEHVPLPISSEMLCLYVQFLSRSLSSPQSIRNYVSGLKTVHNLFDLPFPSCSTLHVRLTFKGLDKCMSHVPNRAAPMSPKILLKISQHVQFDDTEHVVIWSLFLFMFFLFSRKSQFLAMSPKDPHIDKLVKRRDIEVVDGVLQVSLLWTKTRQSGGEPLRIPLLPISNSILCPVRAYFNMIRLIPVPDHIPAFVNPGPSGPTPVLYGTFHRVLRELIDKVGLNPAAFSSHSFRRGGASYAFSTGVRGELIQQHGDWKSDAYKVYLDMSFEQKCHVSQLMVKDLSNLM